ncbi:MAG: DUF420 domain-containing protein [Bacteriovoracaceae bacterium]|nr:DUF420 domain-containing protein [Bacteriovoracaceae bacterium]
MSILNSQYLSKADKFILLFSVLALSGLVWLVYFSHGFLAPSSSESGWWEFIPFFNACMNLTAAACILLGIRSIKRRSQGQIYIDRHKRWMKLAFVSSSLFLVGYLIYHSFHGDSKFQGVGIMRPIYFFILISHILLSTIVFPMVLLSFYWGISNRIAQHKKLAKWTYPLWFYVSLTGVLIFVLLKSNQA